MRLTAVFILLILITPTARAQQPISAPATQIVRGIVVTANDTPLARVRVAPAVFLQPDLSRRGPFPESGQSVLTDIRGEFALQGGPTPLVNLVPLPVDRDLSPPLGDGWNSVSPEPDGTFVCQRVFGPTLLRDLFQQTDWYLKSVVIRGQEHVDSPFDFGTGGTFSGIEVLMSAKVAEASSADGPFTVRGLPPGHYWAAAIERRDRAFEPTADPDLLDSLSSRANRITPGEGQSQDVTLRLVRR